jgi:hypothetical protein
VPLDFWFVEGMPMVLNYNRCRSAAPSAGVPQPWVPAIARTDQNANNRATHCNWTNGTCGRAVRLVTHESEPPDSGEGEFWDLQRPPIAFVFKPDRPAFALGADATEPYAWSKDELVLHPELAKFKWKPYDRDKPLIVWRRNFEVSPALCFTEYKVIGATLESVVIYLPNPAHMSGVQTSFSLQKKLVMLSRTRDMQGLFFLCADDYDFGAFLRELTVPEVRSVRTRTRAPDRLTPAGMWRVAQDLAAEWARLQALSVETHALAKKEPWWDTVEANCTAPPPTPLVEADGTAPPPTVCWW